MEPPATPFWMGAVTLGIAVLSLLSRLRTDWSTASKSDVDKAAGLANQALDLLKAERELSKDRSEENGKRLLELEDARRALDRKVAEQAIDIARLNREVEECHGERDAARNGLLDSTQVIETRRLKIVELECRIAELEAKGAA